MGSDSGRQPGASFPSTLGVPPARSPRLPEAGLLGSGQSWSRSQAREEVMCPPKLCSGGGCPYPCCLHTPPNEAQLPEPSGYKTDGDQRWCQQTARVPFKNVISFYFSSPNPLLPPHCNLLVTPLPSCSKDWQ